MLVFDMIMSAHALKLLHSCMHERGLTAVCSLATACVSAVCDAAAALMDTHCC